MQCLSATKTGSTMVISVLIKWIFLVSFANSVPLREEHSVLDQFVPVLRLFKTSASTTLEKISESRQSKEINIANRRSYHISPDTPFFCPLNITKSEEKPVSVHRLRPDDIDVVGALGDSLTAGFGIDSINHLSTYFFEARGSSFSIGGTSNWKTHFTIPNILKMYNPHIYGASNNSITIQPSSGFNVAEGGAISENMPFMAKVLVQRIKKDPEVNLKDDWKMITVFIGHNDFCSVNCYKKDFNPDKILSEHKEDMLAVLRILRDNLPRTLVNIIPPIHMSLLFAMTNKTPLCYLTQVISCPCFIGLPHAHLKQKSLDLVTKWQQLDLEIAKYPEFDKEDFTVIGHDYMINYSIPLLENGQFDYGYLAPDCFHLSKRGHAKLANDLWNSLLEPVGKKQPAAKKEFTRILCPTKKHPYIYTRRNSNIT